jgi:hypothetical protein
MVVAADLRGRSSLLNGVLTNMDLKFQLAQPENVLVDFIDSDVQRFVREEIYNNSITQSETPRHKVIQTSQDKSYSIS